MELIIGAFAENAIRSCVLQPWTQWGGGPRFTTANLANGNAAIIIGSA